MSAQIKTRKKKAQPAPQIEVAEEPVVSAPSMPTHVSISDLWAMRFAQQEKKTAEAQADAARMQRLYVLAKIDPKGLVLGIEKKLDDAKAAVEAAENRALIAKKRMEHALGRQLTGLAIDPDSGEVQIP